MNNQTVGIVADERKKIAIIDDEIGPVRRKQLTDQITNTLGDSTSPVLAEIWSFGERVINLKAIEDYPENEISEIVFSKDFLNKVVMSSDLLNGCSMELKDILEPFHDLRSQNTTVLDLIISAFPEQEYEVDQISERPADHSSLLGYSLIVMDVMMDDGLDFEGVGRYLAKVTTAAGDTRTMPPILLISHRADQLDEHRRMLRNTAKISAPGFCLVPKAEIKESHFGSRGVQLLWKQMSNQAAEAESIRKLFKVLGKAYSDAWEKTEETLWNLDVTSLQQIHHNARLDNDPFDEHSLELISRHHLWHVEGNALIQQAVMSLSNAFDVRIGDNGISHRCVNYSDKDLNSMRQLASNYRFTAFKAQEGLNNLYKNKDFENLNKYLPFGSLFSLTDTPTIDSEILIHLTQQCDLNRTDLHLQGTSLIFVKAKLLSPENTFSDDKKSIFIRGVDTETGDYNLVISKNSLIALPSSDFPALIKKKPCKVISRLRTDVARQILQEVVNHTTRIADMKVTEGQDVNASICIRLCSTDKSNFNVWYGEDGSLLSAKKLRVSCFETPHLLGEDSFKIPLWVSKSLEEFGLPTIDIDLYQLSNTLRSILPKANKLLEVGGITIKVVNFSADILEVKTDPFEKEKVGDGKFRLIIGIHY